MRTTALVKDPIFRCLEREVSQGATLLELVRTDLKAVVAVCAGERKATNHVRGIMHDIGHGKIPPAWAQYQVPPGIFLPAWIADMAKRAKQWRRMSSHPDELGVLEVWLGGLFSAEGYITATRQAAAHASGSSLEELALHVELDAGAAQPQPKQGVFVVTGLAIAGVALPKATPWF